MLRKTEICYLKTGIFILFSLKIELQKGKLSHQRVKNKISKKINK